MKNNQDLNELIKSATEQVDENLTVPTKKKKTTPVKLFVFSLVVLLILGAGVLVFKALNPNGNQDFVDKTDTPNIIVDIPEVEDINKWGFDYPAEVPEWSKQPYSITFLDNEENLEILYSWVERFEGINFATSFLPSGIVVSDEYTPYTNDLTKELLDDGDFNMYFSYVLREDYLNTYSIAVNRLLNPVFGDWVFAQSTVKNTPVKNDTSFEVLKDMFSESWWKSNVNGDYSSLPIIADWDGNGFDAELAEREPERYGTFYGVVTETPENQVRVTDMGAGHRGHSILKVETPVTFYAFGKNDKIERKGTLVITLAPNEYEYSNHYRVVVSAAELILD